MVSSNLKPIFLGGFQEDISQGIFVKRYKRFFADIYLPESKKTLTVHCPNTGSMKGMNTEGCKALISRSNNPNRKLTHTLECLQVNKTWVCVNTHRANAITKKILQMRLLPGLKNWKSLSAEPRYGEKTRFDFLLQPSSVNKPRTFVEVKSVTLSEAPGIASFPDAVTDRGLKHLKALEQARIEGYKTTLIFLIFRGDCTRFKPAIEIDPIYAQTLTAVKKAGLKILTPTIKITTRGFYLLPQHCQQLGF